MNPPLSLLRYALLLAPAVAQPYMAHIPSYPVYISSVLLLLALVRFREKAVSLRLRGALFMAEALWSAWLLYDYGGLLYVFFWSLSLSLYELPAAAIRPQWLLALAAGMNAALLQGPGPQPVQANLGFAAVLLLLQRSAKMEVGREELQGLYDEMRKKHYELEEARKQIVEYARIVGDIAQTEERNRIAHDLHDDLGHKLIRLKMMLEAVLHIMPAQPEKGMEMIRQVRDQLTDSMETMRKTVRKLKPDESDVQVWSLDRLIEELSREPGLRVRYRVAGQQVPLYPSCEITLYRNAQEAITNAIRHGRADEVDVVLAFTARDVSLTVSNNGAVPERMDRKGLGVSGMEERTRLVGGELEFALGERFSVTTRIPLIRE